jgi:hypothetical protein
MTHLSPEQHHRLVEDTAKIMYGEGLSWSGVAKFVTLYLGALASTFAIVAIAMHLGLFDVPQIDKRVGKVEATISDQLDKRLARIESDIGGLRTEMKTEIGGLRTEMNGRFTEMRSEMNDHFNRLEKILNDNLTELRAISRDHAERLSVLEIKTGTPRHGARP